MRLYVKKSLLLLVIVVITILAVCSCSPEEKGNTVPNGSPDYGGTLRFSYFEPATIDPHFTSDASGQHFSKLWCDTFVFMDEENNPSFERGIAESYEVDPEGKKWTFKIRKGVKFHDGREMNAQDVKFSFDRLRDPEVGSPAVDMYSNIREIKTSDDYTVVFELNESKPEFLKDLGTCHALIADANCKDFRTDWNGTGPFVIESYTPGDRAVLKRNQDYWLKDENSKQLPYLDGLEFIFMEDQSAQVEALRGGQLDYLFYLPLEPIAMLKEEADINVYQAPSNGTRVIHMRADKPPFDDVRVRQALKLATDRSDMLVGAIEGLGVTGRDTPIGPAFALEYLDVPELKRDIKKAKELLAEAGYPEGFDVEFHCIDSPPFPSMAVIWKEQLEDIGVNLDIQLHPSSVYYDEMWLEVELGASGWGARPAPLHVIELAYVKDALWNQTHWNDPELNELVKSVSSEMDENKRIELYHQIQEIFFERGPIIVPFWLDSLWAARKNVKGIRPTKVSNVDLDLRYVYFSD